jgi:hypothetical protein
MTGRPARVRLKPIALPAEHGSWGFLLEPVLLGLALAPTLPGLSIAATVVAAFLLRNPLRIFLRSRGRVHESPRRTLARSVALVYAAFVAVGVVVTVALMGWKPFWPLLVVGPLGVAFLFFDSKNQSRSLTAELAGGIGLAAAAPSIVLCDGWTATAAMATWAIVVAKAVPTVVYIRARLRLEGGENVAPWPAVAGHTAAAVLGTALGLMAVVPWLTVAMLILLLARAALGLSPLRWGKTTKQIGILEFVFSGLYVFATAVGFRGGL